MNRKEAHIFWQVIHLEMDLKARENKTGRGREGRGRFNISTNGSNTR